MRSGSGASGAGAGAPAPASVSGEAAGDTTGDMAAGARTTGLGAGASSVPVSLRSENLRAALLAELGATSDGLDQTARVDAALDEIAAVLQSSFDIPRLAAIAGLEPRA